MSARGCALFDRDRDRYVPSELTRSPWDAATVSGAGIAALLAHLLETSIDAAAFNIARLTIDILGKVPQQPLTGRNSIVRDGRSMRIVAVDLVASEAVVARATALCVRRSETPPLAESMPYPLPESLAPTPFTRRRPLLEHVRARSVRGAMHVPGPGTLWTAFDLHLVPGMPLSPFARAAVLGDFGSGVGSGLPLADWSYPNLDITIHFVRQPRGEWLLVDSSTQSSGNGFATARCVFADREGIYGRGFQTLFVSAAAARAAADRTLRSPAP